MSANEHINRITFGQGMASLLRRLESSGFHWFDLSHQDGSLVTTLRTNTGLEISVFPGDHGLSDNAFKVLSPSDTEKMPEAVGGITCNGAFEAARVATMLMRGVFEGDDYSIEPCRGRIALYAVLCRASSMGMKVSSGPFRRTTQGSEKAADGIASILDVRLLGRTAVGDIMLGWSNPYGEGAPTHVWFSQFGSSTRNEFKRADSITQAVEALAPARAELEPAY